MNTRDKSSTNGAQLVPNWKINSQLIYMATKFCLTLFTSKLFSYIRIKESTFIKVG